MPEKYSTENKWEKDAYTINNCKWKENMLTTKSRRDLNHLVPGESYTAEEMEEFGKRKFREGKAAGKKSLIPTDVEYNFSKRLTTAYFPDGTKVTVKCSSDDEEDFDEEVGLAECIMRKLYGSRVKFLEAVTWARWED